MRSTLPIKKFDFLAVRLEVLERDLRSKFPLTPSRVLAICFVDGWGGLVLCP